MSRIWINRAACFGLLVLAVACSRSDLRYRPTGKAAFVPGRDVPFTRYVDESRENIEKRLSELNPGSHESRFLGGYTSLEAAAMRSPFQIPALDDARCDDAGKGVDKGFLLIHGLTDSPYMMRSIADSLHSKYQCALIRAVLLPGHGTVPGDTLKMKYQDWEKIVEYGIDSFKRDETVKELYLAGFSTGSSLAINYMKKNPGPVDKRRNDKIKGLILLSAAVKAKTPYVSLTPFIKLFWSWASIHKEQDAARYESFSMNAGAQFYRLTRGMADPGFTLGVPVLMAVSADDATVDAEAAREFFCYPTGVERRLLIWYQSIDPAVNAGINQENTPELMCSNIEEVNPENIDSEYNTVNLAHTALTIRPEDPHYGFAGRYHNCTVYDKEKTSREFMECQGDEKKNIFGENNVAGLKKRLHLDYDYLRRGTFNPDYKNLESKILCFTDDKCSTGDLLGESNYPGKQVEQVFYKTAK